MIILNMIFVVKHIFNYFPYFFVCDIKAYYQGQCKLMVVVKETPE